jgi:tetratricopeptide (TPR) repeat protein
LTLTNLGTVLHERQQHAEAVPLLREAVDIFVTQANARPREAAARQNLAAALGAMGQREEAERQFRQALQAREAMYGPSDVRVAVVLNNIASMWQRAEQPERAEPDFRRAVQIARDDPNATWGLRGQLEVNWAWSLLRTGRFAEAGTVFRGLLAASDEVSERIVLDTHWGLARCLAETGNPVEAERQFNLAMERVDTVLAGSDPNRWKLRLQLGEFFRDQNREAEAIPLLALAADSLRASGPEVVDDAQRAARLLAQLRGE